MTPRQIKIWDLLSEHESLTSGELARLLHISDRTVRTDIMRINELMKQEVIKARKGQGYFMEAAAKRPEHLCADYEAADQDLEWNIVRRVLFQEKTPYPELADELYISDTLLSKAVNRINQAMNHRYSHGKLQKKQGFLVLDLSETDKRKFYHTYVTLKNVNHFFSLEDYQPYFEYVDLDDIKDLLLTFLKDDKEPVYDTTVMRLLISTAILAERASAGYLLDHGEILSEESKVSQVIKGVERLILKPLPPGEVLYLEKILRNDFYYMEAGDAKRSGEILSKILIEISVEYGFDFSHNQEFCMEMEAQLNGTIRRVNSSQWAVNPALARIKSKYPLEYDIAIFFADRLKRLTDVFVSEDEIGQFAVHFIRAMEQNLKNVKQKVSLINPYGKQIKDLMKKRLEEIGEHSLEIAYIYSLFDFPEEMPKDAIAVLTTVPLKNPPRDLPVILCKNFLDYQEKEKLMTVVKDNQVSTVKTYFRTLFKPSLFFIDMEFDSKERALAFLCDQLCRQGYVDEGYYDSVLKREHLAPTAFLPGFAFVHAMENNASRTAVCTCVLKNKLHWGDYEIKIIFLFALASSWNHTMIPVYNVMIDHLFQSNTIHKLAKKKDCKSFVELLF